MGRTNPTYRRWLDRYEADWQPFRRALRAECRDDFDRLFERAATYAGPAGYQNATTPEWACVMAILLSQERELRQLRERVETD